MKSFIKDTLTSPFPYIEKDPDDRKDYTNDWTEWLAQSAGDVIASSVWTVASGLVLGTASFAPTVDATNKKATAWLSGGTAGQSYVVENKITTVGGRIASDSFTVKVKQQ